jgi:hypothetical protein
MDRTTLDDCLWFTSTTNNNQYFFLDKNKI